MLISYDINKMKEFLKSFYTITNIRIVVFSSEFIKIAEVPDYDCDFCVLIRSDASAEGRCRQSDCYACKQCREQNHLYSYTCHAGLTESVAPIYCGNIVVGYIMFGQVLQSTNIAESWEIVARRCASYHIDMSLLKEAFFKKQPLQLEQLYASAQLLEACAGYLWLQRSIYPVEDSLPKQIDEYLSENLHADLSARMICKRFSISRSKLYKIAMECYGCGIEQLTRRLRVGSAKKLLETTEYPLREIAYHVGYQDYNYFIKVFKKETGTTPARYRKQYRIIK